MSLPYDESRRLTGCNPYFDGTGAALETTGGIPDDAAVAHWRQNISAARGALHWPPGVVMVRRHATGASLAFTAPADQLYAATEVNEWAWSCALAAPTPRGDKGSEKPAAASAEIHRAPGHAAFWEQASALNTLRLLAAAEANPALLALLHEAAARNLPSLPDDEFLTLGEGIGSVTWPIDALPSPADVGWNALHAIQVALVTGSNGKTTTVRALAAICRAHGWRTAHSCTDGVFVDGDMLESGDFSGPGGARAALRTPDVEAAVLEAARGGILRRGLALCHAQAAIVTNISADHFGEYGIHTLDELAQVKLTVARAIQADGLLVLNADDDVLTRHAGELTCPIGWFSLDAGHPRLAAHRDNNGTTCAPRDGHLYLHRDGIEHDLGDVADMPLSFGGHAAYNIANLAAAALGAIALGIPADTIARTLHRFGEAPGDNPGRMQRWTLGGVRVVLDYAHNVDGLQVLMQSADAARGDGRLALVLGHAGNREDDDYRALAAIAARYRPGLVVLKDIDDYLRGRAPGEIAGIMRDALLENGVSASNITIQLDETRAALDTLRWARPGDLLVLPIHSTSARDTLTGILDDLRNQAWQPGSPLPVKHSP
ncbi:MAG: Mur ligase family protein [Luteimonas sp.]